MDFYAKGILTIIAAALCVLVVQNAIPGATAFGHDKGCGQSQYAPCYLDVRIRQ